METANKESVLHFCAENSVLLLNGSFVQSAASVRYDAAEPLYVTVLPLEASHLPYTVEILGGKAVTNVSLAPSYDMGSGHFFIELKPRYAYIYSSAAVRKRTNAANVPSRLLEFVRERNFSAARSLLSDSLSESVTDDAIADFFDGVLYLRENIYTPEKGWLLIKSDGTAPRCDIKLKNGLIENIIFD